MSRGAIWDPGKNCWRLTRARRVSFLVDAHDYYRAFAAAAEKARESICILGWDVDSRTALRRDGEGGAETELESFLRALLKRQPRLRVRVLAWDFAMIFALEREWAPLFNLRWSSHRRLRFRLDGHHPLGASHHQKVVVIDDTMAFAGGLDLTKRRWDTPQHRPEDPRRVDPEGQSYRPFHDVQMAVDGEAARALGELFRERWRRSGGGRLQSSSSSNEDAWPEWLEPDLEEVQVGIARTFPAYDGEAEVREVEKLYLDSITAAERSIYIENQYFTSSRLQRALAERLQERNGPEIVMVVPRECSGWLEESTMGAIRAHLVRELREKDREGRFRIYFPVRRGENPCSIFVHSKVMVVDDRFVRVGSSNLSNRSMGFDSECDLSIDVAENAEARREVVRFRDRLVAEHLGVPLEDLSSSSAPLIEAIESFRGGEKDLEPLEADATEYPEPPSATWLADPERPIEPDRLLREFLPPEPEEDKKSSWLRVLAVAIALGALAAAWRFTPLAQWLDVEQLTGLASSLQGHPAAMPLVVGVFVVAGLLMVPVTLLVLVTAMTFEAPLAILYAVAGTSASAALSFLLGSQLGRETIRRLSGRRLNRLSQKIARRGFLAMTAARVVPMAPFTVVNLVAGASHIRFRDFFLGTIAGMTPGIVGVALFGDRLAEAVRAPSPQSVVVVVVLLAAIAAVAIGLRRWFRGEED